MYFGGSETNLEQARQSVKKQLACRLFACTFLVLSGTALPRDICLAGDKEGCGTQQGNTKVVLAARKRLDKPHLIIV